MSWVALLLQGLATVDIGAQLGLHALTVRACMLALASSFAAVAAFRWAGVIYAELHRFIVLFRQLVMLPLCTVVPHPCQCAIFHACGADKLHRRSNA